MVEEEGMSDKVVLVSGGFDPLHIGHVFLFEEAAKHGKLIVAMNSDDWLLRKKGYVFMPWQERMKIIMSLRMVDMGLPFNDDDDTAIEAVRLAASAPRGLHYFANGGDRTKKNVPEQAICDELGVKMLWGIGGETKPQSSSWLVNNAMKQLRDSV